MLSRRTFVIILAAVVWLSPAGAMAEPLRRDQVPEPLKPWVDWALRGYEEERCPYLRATEKKQCVWPAQLDLELEGKGGRFAQRWQVYRESWVALPGDEKHWPHQVQVDDRPSPVIAIQGQPGVHLAAGRHAVKGEFHWDALPELLQTPVETGLLHLSLSGQVVEFPVRDAEGRLWLKQRTAGGVQEESRMDVVVHRHVTDDVPLQLLTQIEIKVSGRNREVLLGRALPPDFIPLLLESPVPARLETNGRLRVQVRPGEWILRLGARHDLPVKEITLSDPGGPWDAEEVWAFEARSALRLVQVKGPPSVDPQQTQLPEAWRALPAYLMKPGTVMRLVEKRRGNSDPAPDRLSLSRTWWLDFDGGGYTISDQITGVVQRSSRLDMGSETTLGRVSMNGANQVITRNPSAKQAGIEISQGPIKVEADSRSEGGPKKFPAVGWNQDFQSVSGRLNLPPGWRLFHATGVDQASTTWVNRWTLLDLFIVLLVAMAFLRLWGPRWGGVALATLILTYTESGAPAWGWVAVLTGEALRRAVPPGRFFRWVRVYWAAAMLSLILIAISFIVVQVRTALHPALEYPGMPVRTDSITRARLATVKGAAPSEEILAGEGRVEQSAKRGILGSGGGVYESKTYSALLSNLYAPDPNARITTGPGLPTWRWRSVSLVWNGPVESTQTVRFFLWSPLANLWLGLLRTLLLAVLVLRVTLRTGGGLWPGRGAKVAGCILVFLAAGAYPARAEIPGKDVLDELRVRLLEKPACHPDCAAIPRLFLDVTPHAFRARLQVDVAAEVAVPLPLGTRDYLPANVLVDGKPTAGLLRRGGILWLPLGPGTYEVILEGALPHRDTIEMPLPLKPHWVEAHAEGWVVHGVRGDGLPEDNLQLSRVRAQGDKGASTLEPGSLPPFFRVEREIILGLSWNLATRVLRVTPDDTTIVLEVPLLPGESVTSAGIRTEKGRALVSMGPGVTEVRWESLLGVSKQIVLKAPHETKWAETWRLYASTLWHVQAEGIPVIHASRPAGRRTREWRPWPDEQVVLQISRPKGIAGSTVTFDASRLALRPGRRATDATLSLQLRSSQGGQHRITLPSDAQLQSVRIDGEEQPIRQEGREVTLPLTPGSQKAELLWRESRGAGAFFKTSEVDLGVPSVNADVQIATPAGRWTLFVGGPRLGPVVLFWPSLVVLVFVALGLGRLPITPLRWYHWLLLGLGLTQVPLWAAAWVAGWFFVLGWRGVRGGGVPGRWFDLIQLALVGITFVFLCTLFFSIQKGLLGTPEMQIAGNGSSAFSLRWYQDRTGTMLPRAWVLSVPLLVYRFAMLAWALWLAQAMVRWLRWGWECFTSGEIWRPLRPTGKASVPPPAR